MSQKLTFESQYLRSRSTLLRHTAGIRIKFRRDRITAGPIMSNSAASLGR